MPLVSIGDALSEMLLAEWQGCLLAAGAGLLLIGVRVRAASVLRTGAARGVAVGVGLLCSWVLFARNVRSVVGVDTPESVFSVYLYLLVYSTGPLFVAGLSLVADALIVLLRKRR